jgi:hypothetical protein
MLAQLQSVSPEFLKSFLIVFIAFAGVALAVAGYLGRRDSRRVTVDDQPVEARIKGQVRTVAEDRFATRDFVAERNAELDRRLNGHDADIRALYAELKADRAAAEIHASQRSSAIYEEIGSVREGLSDKIDAQSKEFHLAVRDLPNQLVALLRNTGVIK